VDAIRQTVQGRPPAAHHDFILPLHVISTKIESFTTSAVHSFEVANSELGSEFRMRTRVGLRALSGIIYMRKLCIRSTTRGTAFSLISHKLYAISHFLFLPIIFVSNLMLVSTPGYAALFMAADDCLPAGIVGAIKICRWPFRKLTHSRLFPHYQCAFAVAAFKFLQGETMATWQPRAGAQPAERFNRRA